MPRKLKEASIIIAEAIPNVAFTKMIDNTLGKMCLNRIDVVE